MYIMTQENKKIQVTTETAVQAEPVNEKWQVVRKKTDKVDLGIIATFDTVREANRALVSIRQAIASDLGWDFNEYEKQSPVESEEIPLMGVPLMTDSKQLARWARFFLKEAILDVLLSAGHTDTPQLRPAEISRRLGIEPSRRKNSVYYGIVRGVLYELLNENRVEYVEFSKGWIIAPEEVQRRTG